MKAVGLFLALRGALATVDSREHRSQKRPPWNYGQGGSDWQEGFCSPAQAKHQSPIDIKHEHVGETTDKVFFYYPRLGKPLELYNNGHTLAATFPETYKGGFGFGPTTDVMQQEGNEYRLYQMSFHAPSEHLLDGKSMPLELQLVHAKRGSDERLGVVSIFFAEGAEGPESTLLDILTKDGVPENPWDSTVVNRDAPPKAPDEAAGQGVSVPNDINLDLMFTTQNPDESAHFFMYKGSLTTPPCDEVVDWFVRKSPVRGSTEAMKRIKEVLEELAPSKGNRRVVQKQPDDPPMEMGSMSFVAPEANVANEGGTLVEMPVAKVSAEELEANKEYQTWTDTDSPEDKAMKEKLQLAAQQVGVADVTYSQAMQAQGQAQKFYEAASGVVDKINKKWNLIAAANVVNGASVAVEAAAAEYHKVLEEAQVYFGAKMASNSTAANATAVVAPTKAAGGNATAAARNATTASQVTLRKKAAPEGPHINYGNDFVRPSGAVASPFSSRHVEDEVRIGKGPDMMPRQMPHLQNNLRQPEGPSGLVPPGVLALQMENKKMAKRVKELIRWHNERARIVNRNQRLRKRVMSPDKKTIAV